MPQPRASLFPSPRSHSIMGGSSHSQITEVGPPTMSCPDAVADADDDSRLSDRSSSAGPSGEETETAPEGEGDDPPVDDSITRCICDFTHDDGYMIQCDHCL